MIDTERLTLRRLTTADADEMVAIQSHPDIARFVGGLDRAGAIEYVEQVDENWAAHGYGRLGIVQRATGRLLGRTGLMYVPQFRETELGWTLRRDAWGHGYATEAAHAAAEWGLRDLALPYLISLIEPANTPSLRVAGRLGMTPLRDDVYMDIPMVVHSLTRDPLLVDS